MRFLSEDLVVFAFFFTGASMSGWAVLPAFVHSVAFSGVGTATGLGVGSGGCVVLLGFTSLPQSTRRHHPGPKLLCSAEGQAHAAYDEAERPGALFLLLR